MYRSFLVSVFLCGCAAGALADQITLKNGDRLTGTVVKSDGKVIGGALPYETNRLDVAVTNGIISEIWVPEKAKPKK